MTFRIGILEVGRPPVELAEAYPSYAHMTSDWLAPFAGHVQIYPIMDGAPLPDPSRADLWAITGSRCAVYEDHPWLPGLLQFVLDAKHHRSCRLLGICFGHQLIAKALGGTVIQSPKGWGVGVHTYRTESWPKNLGHGPQALSICAYHQDQIITPPEASHIVASSDFCPVAGLWYPGFALSFQPHPEFSVDYERDLIRLKHRQNMLPEHLVQPALHSTDGPCNRLELRDAVVNLWQTL